MEFFFLSLNTRDNFAYLLGLRVFDAFQFGAVLSKGARGVMIAELKGKRRRCLHYNALSISLCARPIPIVSHSNVVAVGLFFFMFIHFFFRSTEASSVAG